MHTPRHPTRSITIMASALLALFLLSFVMGRYGVPLGQVVRILLSGVLPLEQTWTDNMAIAVLNVRLPRILLACLVGCGLSAAGTGYQTVFQNPQILVPFHPEMSHISVIIKVHLQLKILEKDRHNRLALIYNKHVFSVLLA